MKRLILSALAIALLASCGQSNDSSAVSELRAGFDNPPSQARPLVWWHWMNGNITKDGIKKDLEWMDRVGIGGVQHFDATGNTATVVDKRLIYMDEGWKDAFAYAVRTADSLGLEFGVASAPGWSSTGGPWVKPENGMKKLVWRTVTVNGGQSGVVLPAPFTTTGAFQNGAPAGRGAAAQGVEHYEDIAVMAVKVPDTHKTMQEMGATVLSSKGSFTVDQLTDGDITNSSTIPYDAKSGTAWLMYEFPQAQTIKSLTIAGASSAELESSNDGEKFTKVCDLRGGRVAQSTLSIPVTTAKYFRLLFRKPEPGPRGGFSMFGMAAPASNGVSIAEFELFPYSRVNRAEDKAGFSMTANLVNTVTPSSDESFPTVADVVDLTDKMNGEGRLEWQAPEGKWKIYRFGWSLTGKQNHPAPAEATGLEVDKLDQDAWTDYFITYFDMYKDAADGLIGQNGLQYVLTDSYEAEHQNWTPKMFEEFSARRGYDLHAWLPVLAGEVIGSPEQSDAFLWDWRMNLGDLISASYDKLTEIAQQRYGMKGRYTESHEAGRAYVGDGMDLKRTSQVPMSAMWVDAQWLSRDANGEPDRGVYKADDRESASVAHIYGQNIAAAESMTVGGNESTGYAFCPENLKEIADIELASGINRFVIHESAHQPLDDKFPGMSLGGVGQWFNRHETWAEMATEWVSYMSRSSFMLQSGKNVADVLYYYGEESCICSEFGRRPPVVAAGYEWDYCSPHALLNQISAKRGRLVSASGTEYRVLWMDRNVDYMSVKVLRKIAELAKAGVYIGGAVPKYPAGLSEANSEFDSLVKDIWGSGRSNVIACNDLQQLLDAAGVEPDVILDKGMNWLHRTMDGVEIYWINKPSKDYCKAEVSFRVEGLRPQIWHADNGTVEEDVTYRTEKGRTVVELELVPDDAVFVVFAGEGAQSATKASYSSSSEPVEGDWTVSFQQGRGAPAGEFTIDALKSFTESSEFGIKYFSGEALYRKTITVNGLSDRIFIDLGSVKNIAEVYVNGQLCGTAWKEPFRVDITKAVKEGENLLEVKVANLWVNRLIGDCQPQCKEPVTYTCVPFYKATSTLRPSGLLGPVLLLRENKR